MSKKLECPHCNEPSFTAWRKQTLGPARKIKCSVCGARVSVSTLHSIPMILMAMAAPIGIGLAGLKYGWLSAAAVLVISSVILISYYHFFVPLVVRSKPESE
jgi:hypothetical protein